MKLAKLFTISLTIIFSFAFTSASAATVSEIETILDKCGSALSNLTSYSYDAAGKAEGEKVMIICQDSVQKLSEVDGSENSELVTYALSANMLYLSIAQMYVSGTDTNEDVCNYAFISFLGFSTLVAISQDQEMVDNVLGLISNDYVSAIFSSCAEQFPDTWNSLSE